MKRPITYNGDLQNLPQELEPLKQRPQWAVWRWEQRPDGSWSKPPFMTAHITRYASQNDPTTWSTYAAAVRAVNAGGADGVTYMLTEADGLSAIDVDHCRDPDTGSIEPWANYAKLRAADLGAYAEATPSGTGIRIWGSCDADAKPLYKTLELEHGDGARIELFRRRAKPLTITGYNLNCGTSLSNIDKLFEWAIDHGKRHKRKPAKPEASQKADNSTHKGPSDAEIDALIRGGPLPAGIDRSTEFARVVGYLHGNGWTLEQAANVLAEHPNGVAQKYSGRVPDEVQRVWDKLEAADKEAEAGEGLFQAKSNSDWTPPNIIRVSRWDGLILPDRKWSVPDRIPHGVPVLLWGDGGLGKSTIGMHLSAAKALGKEWLNIHLEPRPALFIDAEESEDEIHRRTDPLRQHYGVKYSDMERCGLQLVSLLEHDAVLAAPNRHRTYIQPTRLFEWLLELVGDTRPGLITIASTANVFAGDENNRSQVGQFMHLISRLCSRADATVQLIGHPSVRGMETGTGTSGSTQWHNACRGRMYLTQVKEDMDLRELAFLKNQYGSRGVTVQLRYMNGLFLPITGATPVERASQEAATDETFCHMLVQANRDNVNTSLYANSPNYAPRKFAAQPEAKEAKLTERQLAQAMERLIKAGKIKNESYGAKSRGWSRLVISTGCSVPEAV